MNAAPDDSTTPQALPTRPRRALELPTDVTPIHTRAATRRPDARTAWAVRPARVARVAVPMAVALAGLSGVAYAAWPQPSALTAIPAVQPPAAELVQAAAQPAHAQEPTAGPSATEKKAAAAATKAAATAADKAEKKADKKAAEGWKETAEVAKTLVPELDVTGDMYATTELNLRTRASRSADVVTTVDGGSKLQVTDVVSAGFRLVKADGKARWVSNKYLSDDKPKESDLISGAPCSKGSAMERGLTSDAIAVHRAMCAKFPQVSSFGGMRAGDGGFHGSGRAIDAMISDSEVGWEIARWVRANAKSLGVSEVIYAQKIWTVQRSGEGWRGMSDRGSATANHYDHVHVSVYGSAGTV